MTPIQFATALLQTGFYLLKYDRNQAYFIVGYYISNHPFYRDTFVLSGELNGKALYDMTPFDDRLAIENEIGIYIWEFDITLSIRGIRA